MLPLLLVSILVSPSAAAADCAGVVRAEAQRYATAYARALLRCRLDEARGRGGAGGCRANGAFAARMARADRRAEERIGRACGGSDGRCGGTLAGETGGEALGWPAACPAAAACDAPVGRADCTGVSACLACQARATLGAPPGLAAPGDRTQRRCGIALARETARLVTGGGTSSSLRRLCRACGGADRRCGGGDDPVPAILDDPACPAASVPGEAACGGAIDGVESYVACAACLARAARACVGSGDPACADVPASTTTTTTTTTTTLPPGPEFPDLATPPGFVVTRYASVAGARSLARGPGGTVFVGTRAEGMVVALVDADGDARAERVVAVATERDWPNGVAVRNGALYVAERTRIVRFDDVEARLDAPPAPVVVYEGFPPDAEHGWKFLAFGPDGLLYVPVGAPCNACESPDPYATILRMQPDGTGLEVFARGIRNTVGFDWAPGTGEVWFTDNGRDQLGAEQPGDELDRAPAPGLHFGFPYCHAGTLPDPAFEAGPGCAPFAPPAMVLAPHAAALGMRFYTGSAFPAPYHGAIFVAEHGSRRTERDPPNGYRVSVVRFQAGVPVAYEPFVTGWLRPDGTHTGRPVDVLVMPDGALLVSDDDAGIVYRVAYAG